MLLCATSSYLEQCKGNCGRTCDKATGWVEGGGMAHDYHHQMWNV